MASLLVNARGQLSRLIHSHCTSAALLAERMGLGADVQQAVGFTFERFDGGGLPAGARGDSLPIAMRVAQIADMVEVHHRTLGVQGAVAMVRCPPRWPVRSRDRRRVHRRCREDPRRPFRRRQLAGGAARGTGPWPTAWTDRSWTRCCAPSATSST